MHRLLIADDEHHIVDWLVELFEEQVSLDLEIKKCYSGMEAIKILESWQIDIILLDISMPGISGLEVADKIIKDWPSCRIIFLTGHNNFDYIYQANKKQNITYLLKTEDDEAIVKAVSNAVNSIDQEIKNLNFINEAHLKEQLLQHLLERNFFKDILIGKHRQDIEKLMTWYEKDINFSIDSPIYLLYAKLQVPRLNLIATERKQYIIKLMQLTSQILNNKFQYSILDVDSTTLIWFLQSTDAFSDSNIQPLQYLKVSLDSFVTMCKSNLSFDATFLLYGKAVDWEDIGSSYELLNQYAISQLSVQGINSCGMIYGEAEEILTLIQRETSFHDSNIQKLMSELSSSFHLGDGDHFFDCLKQISDCGNKVKSMHYFPMIEIYQTLSLMFVSYITQYNLSEKIAPQIGLYPLYYIGDFSTWEESFTYLGNLALVIFDLQSNEQVDKTKKLVASITNYITKHISEPLTLTDISEYVNYNSSYVSRLFKQGMGISFSEYLNQVRMEKAKELLKSTNETIETIAKKVGFYNPKYFHFVFKKAVNMSPRDYRCG